MKCRWEQMVLFMKLARKYNISERDIEKFYKKGEPYATDLDIFIECMKGQIDEEERIKKTKTERKTKKKTVA